MDRTAPPMHPATALLPTPEDDLRAAWTRHGALEPLDPVEYAVGHALFEARSDQRAHLTEWLVRRVSRRTSETVRVLSIGCGDGSVDVAVAAALAATGAAVDYLGVEPHPASAHACATRLAAVTGVRASTRQLPFDRVRPTGRFDLVLAVHSLYYVADLNDTLRRACTLLAPGGELIVLHAPLEPLNGLVRLLAPGRRQAFSGEVVHELTATGRRPEVTRIDSRLDLTATGDLEIDRQLLAFAVQARLTPALERSVRAALNHRARPEPGLVVDHPVDAITVRVGHNRA